MSVGKEERGREGERDREGEREGGEGKRDRERKGGGCLLYMLVVMKFVTNLYEELSSFNQSHPCTCVKYGHVDIIA